MMRYKLIIVLYIIFQSYGSLTACRCKDTMSVFQEYLSSDYVFVGKVVGIVDSAHHKEVEFKIFQNIKHVFHTTIKLRIGHSSCDYRFLNDSTYLVYAHKDKHGHIHTNICTRTKLFSQTSAELKELHSHDDMDCKVMLMLDPSEICNEKYEPVCGCDGMTYGNACIAHNNGINHWIWGECRNIKK